MLMYLQMVEAPQEQSLFEQLYLEYRGLLMGVAISLLKNRQDAEDAVHQAFIYVAENISKFSDGVCPKTKSYIVKVVESRAIDLLRQRSRYVSEDFEEHLVGRVQEYGGLSELAQRMSELPERYRNALILRFAYGYEFDEIGKMMRISEVTARKLVSRARNKLEKICKEEGML